MHSVNIFMHGAQLTHARFAKCKNTCAACVMMATCVQISQLHLVLSINHTFHHLFCRWFKCKHFSAGSRQQSHLHSVHAWPHTLSWDGCFYFTKMAKKKISLRQRSKITTPPSSAVAWHNQTSFTIQKLTISLVPLHCCFISGSCANGRRQNWDR